MEMTGLHVHISPGRLVAKTLSTWATLKYQIMNYLDLYSGNHARAILVATPLLAYIQRDSRDYKID